MLSLCGPTRVRLDDRELPTAGSLALGAKPMALLAYLAIEREAFGRREHTREALTTLLWGEFPELQARASLRQALAQLRRVLGDALVIERNVVGLDAELTLDIAPLLTDAPPHGDVRARAALDLDPARFLAGLRVQRDAGFEEWAEGVRGVLRRRHAALLGHAARDAASRLDWAASAQLAARWRDADPLSAEATQVLMEAHHFAGHDSEALAAFAAHRAVLAAETGEAPAAALRQLAARVARAAGAANGAGGAGSLPTPPMGVPVAGGAIVHAPLVGRRREWEVLADAWRCARTGSGRVVVLAGEPGAGKSRLAGDFARRAGVDGATVLRTRSREPATPTAGIPFATAAALLRSALDAPGFAAADGEWLAEVARLVPELRTILPGVPMPARATLAEEWRLHEGAVQLFAALAAEHPLLVVLDDVHWCDAASAGVVRTLVERTESMPVLWCIALGTGVAERDAPGVRLASALAAGAGATSVPLAPLGADDVHALLVAIGAAANDGHVQRLAARLHGVTGGMPGLVLESVRALRAARLIDDGADGWRPVAALAADTRLAAVLEAPAIVAPMRDRVMRLGEDGRSVLLTIALAGDACTPALLSLVHGVSRLRAAAIGDALVERGLAREEQGAYRVTNELVADAVRHWGSGARRAEVERALNAARAGGALEGGVRAGPMPAPARGTGEWRSSV
jgi:DNA-binding SARP family transcriptional activator